MNKEGYIYIMTNKNDKVLYVGVTKNLKKRVFEHKTKHNPKSFSARYNLDKLVYFEAYINIEQAIAREKQLKAGSRKKKIELIKEMNNGWEDLYENI